MTTMKLALATLALSAGLLLERPATAAGQVAGASCLTQPDTAAILLFHVKRRYVTITDPARLQGLGMVPIDTADVALETDDAVCAAAAVAYNTVSPPVDGAPPLEQVYVIRAGTDRFYVVDLQGSTHRNQTLLFDPNWTLRGRFVSLN